MSDYLVKVIPAELEQVIANEVAGSIIEVLQESIKADEIEFHASGKPFFVDCGSNLEEIKCPLCGAVLDFGWWGGAMEEAGENEYEDLSITLPCCGQNSTLHKLEYHFPCGFARAEFVIRNPEKEPSDGAVKQIEELAGLPVRVIHSHI